MLPPRVAHSSPASPPLTRSPRRQGGPCWLSSPRHQRRRPRRVDLPLRQGRLRGVRSAAGTRRAAVDWTASGADRGYYPPAEDRRTGFSSVRGASRRCDRPTTPRRPLGMRHTNSPGPRQRQSRRWLRLTPGHGAPVSSRRASVVLGGGCGSGHRNLTPSSWLASICFSALRGIPTGSVS